MTLMLQSLVLISVALSPWFLFAAQEVPRPFVAESPNGRLSIAFQLDQNGRPQFEVAYNKVTIAEGTLGLKLSGAEPLAKNLKLVDARQETRDRTYAIPVGKASRARDHHRELVVLVAETAPPHRRLELAFRAFDDGVAFRYQIPAQDQLAGFVLTEEQTKFRLPGDPLAYLLPLNGYTTSYEKHYQTARVSEISPDMLLGLPLLLHRTLDDSTSIWFAITEANLTDYAGLYLASIAGEPGTLAARLSPLPGRDDGAKVLGKAPHPSPWRVLMVADHPGRLIESNLVFHLSDPPKIADTSWIKPGKTTFPWWNGYVLGGVDFQPGVNTATMKHYIDFCAEQGIPYHSLDGLDIAWYGGPIQPQGPTDVTRAAPSIDMPEVLRYAKEKGVRLRVWTHWKALKPQIDEAFRQYEKWGIEGVMVDFMDRDDQEMVRFYHEMARKAARHRLTLTFHGAYKPTGMERTWPNVLSYEGVLNQEYDKWDPRGTPPEHNLDVAFIRMLAGPLDYHQGGMRSVLSGQYRPQDKAPPVQGTRGHQLAMYVVYQNHMSMMADYPAAYRGEPGLEFMVQVPATWDETRVLHAEMRRSLVIARRQQDDWYLGGMTTSEGQKLELPLDFLGKGAFRAELYFDDTKGSTSLVRQEKLVTANDKLKVVMPPEGGFAARLVRTGR